jgi:hypothetical protein
MKKILLTLFTLYNFSSLQAQHKLTKLWETDTILKVPESVLYDGKILYVSNIDGTQPWAKDGKGSIGKVGLDGKVITVDWVTGLNAPKGMGIYKNKLYVADITEVVVIDIAKASIIKKINIDSAQTLNDITIDKKGVVYVSDSKGKKVYQIKNDVPSLMLDNLKRPNGLLATKDAFYVLDDGAMYRMEKDKKLTLITNGMDGGTDGIENVSGKDFIVSCWAGAIWYVKADGTKELLLDTQAQKINTADIGFDAKKKIVYVPTFWKNSVVAYGLQ